MKKNYVFAVVLGAAVLAGCSQDEQLDMVQENRLGFTGVLESSESRTALGDDNKVNWVANEDQVSIFEKDDQNTQYKVKSVSDGVAQFEFINYTEKDNPATLDANYAVYPYNANNSISADGVISATIPSTIENYSDKDDAISKALMVAKSTTTELKFSNAQGILLLRLNAQKPNNYGAIKSIKLASAKYKLAGTATMSWANNVEKPEAKIDDNGTNELTINLASALQTPLPKSADGDYVEYYIPVVPTTFEKNTDGTGDVTMTITFEKGDYVKNIGIEFTVGRNKIKPLKHTVGTQDFTGTTEGTESIWDGEALTVMTPVNGVYSVTKPSELAWLTSQGALTSYDGTAESVTIELMNNLDMGNKNLSALIAQRGDGLVFKGNGKTISNVNIISGEGDNNTGQASMFYAFPKSTLTVSDLTLENITVTADANGSGYAATVVGYCEGAATLNNVDVVNATVTGVKSSGMLVGHLSGSVNATNCNFTGTVTLNNFAEEADGHYAGKYIGTLAGAANLINCSADVTVNGSLNTANVGDVYGRKTNEGSLIIDGVNVVSTTNDLNTTLANGATNILISQNMTLAANSLNGASSNLTIGLASGTTVTVSSGVTTGSDKAEKNLTFTGEKSSTVVFENLTPGYEGKLAYLDGVNLNFEGITFDANQISGICARGGEVTFENCHITGELEQTIASKFKFIRCTFDVGVTQVGYGCPEVVFESCTFETTNGYGIKIYKESNAKNVDLEVKNCSFKNTGTDARSAILLDHIIDGFTYNITVEGCEFEGYTETPTATYNKWAERMIVEDSFVKTTEGQYIFSYQTGAEGGNYHKILTETQLVVTVK